MNHTLSESVGFENEDPCSICLEMCPKKYGSGSSVGCENGHFVHFGCFALMACSDYNNMAVRPRLKCPVCRGCFQCGGCGLAMSRFMCLHCAVVRPVPTTVTLRIHALMRRNNDRIYTVRRNDDVIILRRVLCTLLSILALSWFLAMDVIGLNWGVSIPYLIMWLLGIDILLKFC